MTGNINYIIVEFILQLYCDILPHGENYFTIATEINVPKDQEYLIFDFLIQHKLIEKYEYNESKHVITGNGINAVTSNCGIENYLRSQISHANKL